MITETTAILRLAVSLALGVAIGLERELNHHHAGIRTFALISLGSTLAMILSIYVCEQNMDLHNGDPGRIAAQVLTGIGFIGAGLILKNEEGVTGLTTAAGIFMTACIGLAVGAGMIKISVIVTVAVVILLFMSHIPGVKEFWHRRNTGHDQRGQ